jgi:ParB family chromosome partitioning protein
VAEPDRRGMGRGLSAILPQAQKGEGGLREIPVDLVRPNPRQPRRSFDEAALAELADSIRTRGVLQPIVVRALPGGHYELVAGERRLRAARIAGLESVPAMVREADDWERLDLALAENMARVDLNPIEEARACALLVDDLGLTK